MAKYLLLLLNLCIIASASRATQREYFIYDTKAKTVISVSEMAKNTKNLNMAFFGEFHDDSLIHDLQYKYLKELYSLKKDVAVSMEMFERDAQAVVNDYMKGKIDTNEFIKNSRPWPDYNKFYKPLLELAKENNQDLIAANIPRKFASLYAVQGKTGVDTVNSAEKAFICKEMSLKEDTYMTKFFETMLGSDKIENQNPNQLNTLYLYYGAQCIKDETMAESILEYLKKEPKKLVVHFNGDFHSNNYLGTVQKVTDRNDKYKLAVITPIYFKNKSEIVYNDSLSKLADYIIYSTEPEREEQPMMPGTGNHIGENSCVNHDITLNIMPENSNLAGVDEITLKNPIIKSTSLRILNTIKIKDVEAYGKKLEYTIKADGDNYNEIIISNPTLKNVKYGPDGIQEITKLKISYEGKVYNKPNETTLIQRHSNSEGIISAAKGEGIYLPGASFYPKGDKDIANFKAQISIPKEFGIVTSCINSKTESQDGKNVVYSVQTTFPIDDMILCGGRYVEYAKTFNGVNFKAYTLDSSANAEKYLDASIEYYKIYNALLGSYPYKDFSIVENFFSTGFGMPGYTLLGSKLMAMPWVTLSPGSLAHEFVHNWWGNSVYVDYEMGNWCEALTTFSSNYYYNEIMGNSKGSLDWRKQSLLGLDALPKEKNYPVNEFKSQRDNYDATVGYQKGGFIFYEIMKLMGKESFFNSLKTLAVKYKGKRAYWSNLASIFDAQAKKDSVKHPIKQIFNSWLKNKNLPEISLSEVKFGDNEIVATIKQKTKTYMSIPIYLNSGSYNKREDLIIKDTINTFTIKLEKPVDTVRLDPNYEALRKLYSWEKPFSLNRTLSAKPIVVMPEKTSPEFAPAEQMIAALKESGYNFEVAQSENVDENTLKQNSLLILGDMSSNRVLKNYAGEIKRYLKIEGDKVTLKGEKTNVKDYIGLLNIDHFSNSGNLCSIMYYKGLANADGLKRFFHYLTYSSLLLNAQKSGRPVLQEEVFPSIGDKKELQIIRK